MSNRTHSNVHGKTGGGNIYYDKRFSLLYKVSKRQDLSREGSKRLKWMDHYAHSNNAALTCRYYGISESCFWKWKKRFEEKGLLGLESISKRPKNVREPESSPTVIEEVHKLRRIFPQYGKEKIHKLISNPDKISVSTVGRIIKRHNLSFRKRKRKRYHSWRWGEKQRIKTLVMHGKPGEHIQIDTIVLHRYNKAFYIKTAIDTVTKIAFAYTYSRNTSYCSLDFLKKLQNILPYEIKNVHTDNGSEFMGIFEQELRKQGIKHYFSHPHCPKEHGGVERFNRTIQEEFLAEGNFYPQLEAINKKIIHWLIEYNFHRPHAALDYDNPLAFYDKNFVKLNPHRPSSIYWTYTFY